MHARVSPERIAIDRQPVAGGLRCSSCTRVKPVGQFAPCQAAKKWRLCRMCNRIAVERYRESPGGQAAGAAYRRRPEVKARMKAASAARKRTPEYRAWKRDYEDSERGRIVHNANNARYRLKRAETPEQRARIQALLDRHAASLAALDAEYE